MSYELTQIEIPGTPLILDVLGLAALVWAVSYVSVAAIQMAYGVKKHVINEVRKEHGRSGADEVSKGFWY
ncbi:MAG: hypothetical protein AAB955_02815 [Patescibacteria group bacterium]